ncbi:hypothetical protein DH2020_018460 [Rehmannia glutinosa]|uniref:Pectinesterase n=1 Tax=Rehmannia glutinosa TaxID=99300 RepID=A0ABR0WJ00_REHGL
MSAIGVVRQVITTVSNFSGEVGNFRLSNAVTDCLDLMDVSVDQLRSALSASQNPYDTCNEGFDGTNGVVRGLISGSLDQITSLVQNLLSMVKPNPTSTPSRSGARKLVAKELFPDWLKPQDRKLLQAAATDNMAADAVVAADGSGTFTSIEEAIRAAPEYSSKRYVIYIKKGVYKEYVEINKKKWNIMMIGDGVDVTISFDGTVVFQKCEILARKGLPNQKNTITAQGRKHPTEDSGFSIQFCNISAEPAVLDSSNSTPTYLGRPWKLYSRTVIMQSYISNAIRPEGWLEWNGDFALNTLFYGEYMNYGPGAGLGGRVKWPGYHVFNDSAQANSFTVARFIIGNTWLPSTGVRYTAGLVN